MTDDIGQPDVPAAPEEDGGAPSQDETAPTEVVPPPPPPPPARPSWPYAPSSTAVDATPTLPTPPAAPEAPPAVPYPFAPYGTTAGAGAPSEGGASFQPPPPPPPPPTAPFASSTLFTPPTQLSPPTPPTPPTPPAQGRGRLWLAVAVVSAIIGALIGAGVTALADNGNGNGGNVTIHESTAAPGAAVLSGNVTIPELVKKVIPAVVSIDVKSGGNEDEGTGMIITASGEVVTNNHVIELYTAGGGSGSITVTEYGQKKSDPATLIGYNTQQDVALLKINGASNLPTVTFGNSSKAVVGDAVVAIGNALGLAAGTPTVTQGIVSALGRSVTAGGEGTLSENLQNLLQTDAAINPGNSGGPLIDTAGQVIGMNTAVAGTTSDGTSSQNIGFAIPIAEVESLIPQLLKGGPASNGGGYLGVDISTLTPALRQQYGFTPTSGAVVLTVISGSPAGKAGLQQGDVIVAVDGTAITTAEDLQNAIQKDRSGQTVQITYYVGDSKRTTSVTLGNQTEEQQQQEQTQSESDADPFGAGGFPGSGGSSSGSGSSGGTQLLP
jgi:S1-C subfamily serine protease